jgi:hypothetical protein
MLERTWFRRLHLTLFIAILSAWTIALLSPVPAEDAAKVLGGNEGVFYFAKLLHVVAYLLLTVFGGIMFYVRRSWWLLALALSIHGGLIEVIQPHVGRHGRWQDWLLDSGGVVIGSLLVMTWWSLPNSAATNASPEASVSLRQ